MDSPTPISPDPYLVPPGRRTGCLPRKSAFAAWCPAAAARIPLVPRSEWPRLIEQINNDPLLGWLTLDQDGVGSCASEAASNTIMATRELHGLERVQLSPWFAYHTVSGGVDRGSSIDENLRFARDTGIASMAVWPRSQGWRTKPSAAAYEDAKRYRIEEFYDISNIDEFVSALLTGFVVDFGYDSHSVVATSMVSTSRLRFKNSWGAAWGDNGFGELNLSSIQWGFGAFAVRTAKANIDI